ncbi:MAG: haloacid dehalogenase [Pseudomonadota bacterium]
MPAPFIPPAAVAFDIDGVIADTMTLFLDIAREDYAIEGIRLSDITSYDLQQCLDIDAGILTEISNKIVDGAYRVPLKTMPDAARILLRLADCHSPVLFVTARPYPGPICEWISVNLGLSDRQVEVVTTGSFESKAAVLLDRNISYFVEDRLETCFILQKVGVTPVVFQQPWNRQPHQFIEVDSWPALGALIDISGNGCK